MGAEGTGTSASGPGGARHDRPSERHRLDQGCARTARDHHAEGVEHVGRVLARAEEAYAGGEPLGADEILEALVERG